MLGGADNPNGELPSYITGADSDGGHALAPGLNRDGFTISRSGNPFLDLVIAGIRQ